MSQPSHVTTDPFTELLYTMDFEQNTDQIVANIATDYEFNKVINSHPTHINVDEAWGLLYFNQPIENSISSNPDRETIGINASEASSPSLPLEATKSAKSSETKRPKRPGRYKNASPAVMNRRREQCREAQRKYRERRESRICQLETELKEVQLERDSLFASYFDLKMRYDTKLGQLIQIVSDVGLLSSSSDGLPVLLSKQTITEDVGEGMFLDYTCLPQTSL
ncbi:hypothetical protein VHEMI02467 [[Torrubiella] hemipterigena]|uniref:BZIP domain-containing protein n=1 Tax=[Torrubiella] hemipterigena TaxID=1531966 RepID=A0A0A1SVT7_9HYPO|nr:hypothetical protein VHEMI02467 [[Torrubiella] hemipterigena]